ncbi:DUF4332 domain-containing protein [Rubinisphaera margarita]|uniref:DUF4332 domain-containing protein n=1 Tax=Rubinisphaera margarita TaxID=2909586 RepID=UPI001EE8C01F|nr:DUF4332 domain-containing protein [Rubinisphaera margarita]MCG6154857.1 DUF4332 domain-containing protein [Rubinisphaera margarita]
MRLERISISRPGSDFHVELSDFRPGFNIVYGTNGAGKSTTWNFLRDSLFQDNERRPTFDTAQGQVELTTPDGRAHIRWKPGQTVEDGLTVQSATHEGERNVAQSVKRFRDPLARALFFSCMRDQADLQRMLEAARRDGIELESKSMETKSGKWTLKNQLCPQDRSHEIREEEARIERLHRERNALESEHETRYGRRVTEIERAEQELRQAKSAIESCSEELLRIQGELKAAELAERQLREENCHRTSARLGQLVEAMSEHEENYQRLKRAQDVLKDLEEEATRIRAAHLPGLPNHLVEAETQLLDSLQRDVSQLLERATPCAQCGQHHLQPCDAHWQTLRNTVQQHTAQLSEWSQSHCASHCQCDVNSLKTSNENSREGLTLWIDQLEERRSALAGLWKTQSETDGCPTTKIRLCGCSKHEEARQRLMVFANRFLDEAAQTEIAAWIEDAATGLIDAERFEALKLRQKELLKLKLIAEQDYNRLFEILKGLRTADLQSEFEQRRTALMQKIQDHQLQLDKLRQEVQALRTVDEVVARLRLLESRGMLSPVLTQTSIHLCRHSHSKWRCVRINSDSRKLEALSSDAIWHPWDNLSCGNQQFISTMLRLVIAREYRQQGFGFALTLDDVLADHDYEQQQSAIRILRQYAEDGQQIVYLTCHQHVANACVSEGAHLQQIVKPGAAPFVPESPATVLSRPISEFRKVVSTPSEPERSKPVVTNDPIRAISITEFELEPTSAVAVLPQVGRKRAVRLAGLNVRTIDDLLHVRSGVDQFCKKAGITPTRLRRWQSTARLLCCVPGLKASEARLLALCEIRDAESLAAIEDTVLLDRLNKLRTSNRKSARAYKNHRYGITNVRVWKRAVMHRRKYPGAGTGSSSRPVRFRTAGSTPVVHRSARARGSRPESVRFPREQRNTAAVMDRPVVSSTTAAVAAPVELRFYLSRESAIVDAPSIGPKTAKRLNRVGIKTVRDFLKADLKKIASRLNLKHITPTVLEEWQQQAKLVCCIPQLRGHDAQILVACGIVDPDVLAHQNAEALFQSVQPFSESPRGQRILRSGKAPDLQEVQDWIGWARCSRKIEAA